MKQGPEVGGGCGVLSTDGGVSSDLLTLLPSRVSSEVSQGRSWPLAREQVCQFWKCRRGGTEGHSRIAVIEKAHSEFTR